jgi:hypothetical protein
VEADLLLAVAVAHPLDEEAAHQDLRLLLLLLHCLLLPLHSQHEQGEGEGRLLVVGEAHHQGAAAVPQTALLLLLLKQEREGHHRLDEEGGRRRGGEEVHRHLVVGEEQQAMGQERPMPRCRPPLRFVAGTPWGRQGEGEGHHLDEEGERRQDAGGVLTSSRERARGWGRHCCCCCRGERRQLSHRGRRLKGGEEYRHERGEERKNERERKKKG